MRSTDIFRRFLLLILPAYQQASMAGILSVSALISALIPMLDRPQIEQAVGLVVTLKTLYPHHFRQYHSPFYVEPRSEDLWQNYMLGSWTDDRFRETFRMHKANFYELCRRLTPWLQGKGCNFKKPLSVEKKVAISLHRLAGEITPFHINGETFAVAKSTACKVFQQFVFAVIEV